MMRRRLGPAADGPARPRTAPGRHPRPATGRSFLTMIALVCLHIACATGTPKRSGLIVQCGKEVKGGFLAPSATVFVGTLGGVATIASRRSSGGAKS